MAEAGSVSNDVRELLSSALAHVKAGDLDEAMAALKDLLDRDPENEVALGLLAALWCDLGMHERGAEGFGKLLGRNPGNPLTRIQLGLSQRAAGRRDLALATWKPAVEADEVAALYWSGLVHYENGALDEARRVLARAAAVTGPDHPFYPAVQRLLTLVESARPS
jgi:tetratricopeptide (TPR) repeat protein